MMTDHLLAAARELERLVKDLLGADEPTERLVRLEALARVLLEPGPIARAAAVVVSESRLDEAAIEARAVAQATAGVRRRAAGVFRDAKQHQNKLSEGPLREPVEWRARQLDMGRVTAELRANEAWHELTLFDLRKLAKSVLPAFVRSLARHDEPTASNQVEDVWLTELRARATTAAADLHAAFEKVETAVRFAHTRNHQNTLAELAALVDAADRCCGDSADLDLDTIARIEANLPSLMPRTARLVSAVCARLLAGPDRSMAVDRLKLQLERYDRATLLEAMLKPGAAERALQAAVDRFLFAEGYYPVTHAVAGQGRLDTLFDQPPEAAGMPCIVLELKQVVHDATARALETAIEQGLAQVQHYSDSVRASSQWGRHSAFCIVAYAGPRRFLLPDMPRLSCVRLIYLDTATPSERTTLLFGK